MEGVPEMNCPVCKYEVTDCPHAYGKHGKDWINLVNEVEMLKRELKHAQEEGRKAAEMYL